MHAARPQVDIVGIGLNAFDTVIRLPSFPAFDSKMELLSSQTFPGGRDFAGYAIIACIADGACARATSARSATTMRPSCIARSLTARMSKPT